MAAVWYALRVLTFLALIFFIPLGAGLAFWGKKQKGLAFTLLYGVCVTLALFMIIYLPINFTVGKLSVLTAVYLPSALLLALFGFFRFYRKEHSCGECPALFEKPAFSSREKKLAVVALVLVLLQALRMAIGVSDMTGDDAFYLPTGIEAVNTNLLWAVNPETGAALSAPYGDLSYTLAPWPIFWAVFSSMLNIHLTILCRTVLPAPLTILYYISLWCIFKYMFKDNREKALTAIIFAVLITNILATDQCVSYFWISFLPWYGKAFAPSVICPAALLFFVTLFEAEGKTEKTLLWLGILFASASASCIASTGSVLMLLGFGCWGLVYLIRKRDISILWKLALCVSPSVLQLVAIAIC